MQAMADGLAAVFLPALRGFAEAVVTAIPKIQALAATLERDQERLDAEARRGEWEVGP
jgi:hypothetical protein